MALRVCVKRKNGQGVTIKAGPIELAGLENGYKREAKKEGGVH